MEIIKRDWMMMIFKELKRINKEQEHQEQENRYLNLNGMKLRILLLNLKFTEYKRLILKIILCLVKEDWVVTIKMLIKRIKVIRICKLIIYQFRKWVKEIGEFLKRIMKSLSRDMALKSQNQLEVGKIYKKIFLDRYFKI